MFGRHVIGTWCGYLRRMRLGVLFWRRGGELHTMFCWFLMYVHLTNSVCFGLLFWRRGHQLYAVLCRVLVFFHHTNGVCLGLVFGCWGDQLHGLSRWLIM